MVKLPPPLLTVPAVVVPSPQLIVAAKSPAVFAVLVSLKVATLPVKLTLSTGVIV